MRRGRKRGVAHAILVALGGGNVDTVVKNVVDS